MSDQPSLRRSLGPTDAVVMGLGAMIGAGVFSAIGPAAEAAGPALLLGLVLAAAVAFCNAVASAQLAAVYPESGGPTSTAANASAPPGGSSPAGASSSARPRA